MAKVEQFRDQSGENGITDDIKSRKTREMPDLREGRARSHSDGAESRAEQRMPDDSLLMGSSTVGNTANEPGGGKPETGAEEILSLLEEPDRTIVAMAVLGDFTSKEIAEHLDRYAVPPHHVWFFLEGREKRVDRPSEYFLNNGIGVEKFNIYGVPPEKQQPLIDALLATGIVEISPGAGKDIQFFPKRQKRTVAMQKLFEKLGYGFEEVMSIGDSFLDKDMIQHAAVGVAVGNAADDVKAIADYVSAPFDKDGVAEAIEKFIL